MSLVTFLNGNGRLIARIAGIQRALVHGHSPSLVRLEKELLAEYNSVLKQEEIYWFQKSRVEWLQLGDRSTAFYHATTLNRRR